ncbi:hypothetical protein V2J09_009955 [Rumex salicifolius]
MASHSFLPTRLISTPMSSSRPLSFSPTSSLKASPLCTNFLPPFTGGSVSGEFSGLKVRPQVLSPSPNSRPKRGVVTMVIPFQRGNAWEQPPPDLATYLFNNRIVYLGMCLVPSVTELLVAEFMYLQYDDDKKPIYFYINSTGTTKGGEKLGYETEAFAVYDAMGFVRPPIFTLCVGNAWGEAALLLAAGARGNRSALPSSTIMMRQPIARFQGQATDVEIARKEITNVKAELVKLYARHTGKTHEEIEEDIRRPRYFSPTEAVEYGIIDKVIYNERSKVDRGVELKLMLSWGINGFKHTKINIDTMGVKQAIKRLDAFPRAEEHLLQKTQSGAIVSIIGLVIMASLFIHELRYYLSSYTVHQMSVDLKRGETLPIHINMTFPSLPCDVLSVDAIDMSGKHEVDLDTNIWKLRLNREGHIIGTEYLSDLVEKEHSHNHDHDINHHEDNKNKTHLQGFDEETENTVKNVKEALANGEGCRIYGALDVQRVAGNFHISVHGLNIFVAQMIFEGSNHVNVSHVIHDLSFGPKYPGGHNPLDDTQRFLQAASGTFKYYIKIVPTEYRYISKEVLSTNQFSVTEFFSPMREFDKSWPAVYFLYDLSPITVTIKEHRRNFLHFLTRLCAVLGGTFALTGMLDRWMYRFLEAVMNPNKQRLI